MKKSTLVTLVLSGALMGGCDNRSRYPSQSYPGYPTGANVTNNTYVAGLGYYHAPYRGWFEFPYNDYRPGFGYYHGGIYTPDPFVSDIMYSQPPPPPSRPSNFRTGGSGGFIGSSVGSSSHSSSVSRGGFGSIGHGGSIGS
jgi:hypothetical protein